MPFRWFKSKAHKQAELDLESARSKMQSEDSINIAKRGVKYAFCRNL
ncbi:MAG: hypothetical protein ACE5KT_05185 [Methanosarcinales archaeon]